MYEKIAQFNEELIKGQIKKIVRGSVEKTLNEPLEAGAQKLTQAVDRDHPQFFVNLHCGVE